MTGSTPEGGGGKAPLLERAIPSTGERIPAVGLGTWRAFDVGGKARDRARLGEALRRLVAGGGRVVDTSPMYGRAESVVGDLARDLGLRDRLFLATKVWTTGLAAGIAQMEESFHHLRATKIDLFQVHNLVDAETQLATLAAWKAEGRVRYVGVTHYATGAHAQLEHAIEHHPLDFVQVNYSISDYAAERRLLPLAAERGVAVIANLPFVERELLIRAQGVPLPPWTEDLGCSSWAQLLLKWVLGHPAVTCVIPGSGDPAHVEENLAAARGPLPDEPTRRRLASFFAAL